ncbi:MAG: hypothetical protein ACI4FZ_07130 [Lachnospiraceae bacterium]
MRLLQTLKISVSIFFSMLFVLGTAVLIYPLLQSIFEVQVQNTGETETALSYEAPKEPETVRVQMYCAMNENQTEFTALYVEILNIHAGSVFYFEVPVYTKVTLPQELYRELQVYAPGLPQYLKLSRLPDSFSEEYRMQATLRVLTEVLGISVTHFSCAKEDVLKEWKNAVLAKEKNASDFFECYRSFVTESESDETKEERFVYYDAYRTLRAEWKGKVPGLDGISEFEVQKPLTKELLESCMRKITSPE